MKQCKAVLPGLAKKSGRNNEVTVLARRMAVRLGFTVHVSVSFQV